MKEALNGSEANKWCGAIAYKLRSILRNETWTLTDRPGGHKVLGCSIVLRNKFCPDIKFEKKKVRLIEDSSELHLCTKGATSTSYCPNLGCLIATQWPLQPIQVLF